VPFSSTSITRCCSKTSRRSARSERRAWGSPTGWAPRWKFWPRRPARPPRRFSARRPCSPMRTRWVFGGERRSGVSSLAIPRDCAHCGRLSRTSAAVQLVDPDAETVVRDLALDHRLALVTNGAPDVQREKLSHTAFAPSFEVTIISAELGVGKPDAQIFETALAALDLKPQHAVMIGDSLARDVAGAQAAGMRAIWIDRGTRENVPAPAPVPDARVAGLTEVRSALAALGTGAASPRGSRESRRAGRRDGSRARASRRGGRSAR